MHIQRSQQAVSEGFSLSVTLLNDSGKDLRTEEYYRGCKLVIRARGLNRFTGLFVAAVSAEGLWGGFNVSFLCRQYLQRLVKGHPQECLPNPLVSVLS